MAFVVRELQQIKKQVVESPKETAQVVEKSQQEIVRQLSDPVALAKNIEENIKATAREKIAALPDEKGRWKQVAEIEQERP